MKKSYNDTVIANTYFFINRYPQVVASKTQIALKSSHRLIEFFFTVALISLKTDSKLKRQRRLKRKKSRQVSRWFCKTLCSIEKYYPGKKNEEKNVVQSYAIKMYFPPKSLHI